MNVRASSSWTFHRLILQTIFVSVMWAWLQYAVYICFAMYRIMKKFWLEIQFSNWLQTSFRFLAGIMRKSSQVHTHIKTVCHNFTIRLINSYQWTDELKLCLCHKNAREKKNKAVELAHYFSRWIIQKILNIITYVRLMSYLHGKILQFTAI